MAINAQLAAHKWKRLDSGAEEEEERRRREWKIKKRPMIYGLLLQQQPLPRVFIMRAWTTTAAAAYTYMRAHADNDWGGKLKALSPSLFRSQFQIQILIYSVKKRRTVISCTETASKHNCKFKRCRCRVFVNRTVAAVLYSKFSWAPSATSSHPSPSIRRKTRLNGKLFTPSQDCVEVVCGKRFFISIEIIPRTQ